MELTDEYLKDYLQLVQSVEQFPLSEKEVLCVRKEDTIAVVEMLMNVDLKHQYLCWFEAGQEVFKVHYRGNELTCFVDGTTKGLLNYRGQPAEGSTSQNSVIRVADDQVSFKQAMHDYLQDDQAVQEAFCNQTLLIKEFAIFKLRHSRFEKPITLSSYFVQSAILEVLIKYDSLVEEMELEDLLGF